MNHHVLVIPRSFLWYYHHAYGLHLHTGRELLKICKICKPVSEEEMGTMTQASAYRDAAVVTSCEGVLISSDGMSPWQLSVIHIKSQLALKFGQTPKVCGGGEMWLSANGGSSPQSYWLKLKLTTEANGPEKERVTTTDHYTDDILSANWPTPPRHFSQFELRVLGLVTSWSVLVFNVH
ncbi:hypothetical protein EYF80_041206 [Liparis tanakae]|uniref:Uncharacterized protein n=1 Tax=Liparis tanakae TaxID=230148 RepID=A0A4Z2G4S9_9TELE|nr:hypothetical protein EYF80_041206 [Liparis tanakae]